MEVKSNIIQIQEREVLDAVYWGRARHAATARACGFTKIGPLRHYGPCKERICLIHRAARMPSHPNIKLND